MLDVLKTDFDTIYTDLLSFLAPWLSVDFQRIRT